MDNRKKLTELEHAEIWRDNQLVISCQGEHDCGGWLRIPFTPGIGGAEGAKPDQQGVVVWKRESGETLEDITLSPSINAFECGHFWIRNGRVEIA